MAVMNDKKPVMMITGTRKGIGRYLSEYYLERDYVVVGCSRGGSDLQHDNYRHHCVDVAREQPVLDMFAATREEFGRLDVMLNNAGIASMNHLVLTPLTTIDRILNTNVVGTFLFCREAVKLMTKARYGRIVNFATVATPLNLEGEAAYAASKAAVDSFTRVIAREVASLNITANCVGPTPIETDLIRSVPKEKMDALIGRQAIQRLGEMRDVTNVIDFYIRPESDFITGQTLFLGGV